MPLTPDQRRRRSAKRANEHLKLIATGFNTGAVASTIAVVLVPSEAKGGPAAPDYNWLVVAGLALVTAHFVLRFYRSED